MLAKNYEYKFINYEANEFLKSEDYGGYRIYCLVVMVVFPDYAYENIFTKDVFSTRSLALLGNLSISTLLSRCLAMII